MFDIDIMTIPEILEVYTRIFEETKSDWRVNAVWAGYVSYYADITESGL